MPARVHAFLVVRPEPGAPSDLHLERTLAALKTQSRPVDLLTIVLVGRDDRLRDLAAQSGANEVISVSGAPRLSEVLHTHTRNVSADAVWVLTQGSAPAPQALSRLVAALDTSTSTTVAVPKLVRWDDPARIVSLGTTMTRFGRSVPLARGEFDQGQHDGGEDALAGELIGALVRTDTWRSLEGPDPGLRGIDDGLDLGVRARLAAGRVAPVSRAHVAVTTPPDATTVPGRMRRAHRSRADQLHRRLVYANPVVAVIHWLAILPLALVRSVVELVSKRPVTVLPEWSAAFAIMTRPAAVVRARRIIARVRRVPWSQLASLRLTRRQLRHRLDVPGTSGADPVRRELHFFGGGGAWVVLAMLVVSIAAFPALLAWPVMGGGALAPLRDTVAQLWADAAYGQRAVGWDLVGPADPFSALVALIGTLSPMAPSRALVVLWLLALPLAALGGWFAATRLTDRSGLRAFAALAWALAPTFLIALVDGRPAAVIVHLLLPWLCLSGAAAHRSWASAGVASLVLVGVLAASPSAIIPLGAAWALVMILTAAMRPVGLARVAWVIVPSLVVFAPLIWNRVHAGDPLSLLADPGVLAPLSGQAAGPAGWFFFGFPGADRGWADLLGLTSAPVWVGALTVPILLFALASLFTRRWFAGILLLVIAFAATVSAVAIAGIAVGVSGSESVPLWPGAAVSIAWMALVAAATITLDAAPLTSVARTAGGVIAVCCLAVLAIPSVTATARGEAALQNGPESTLPAYVAAEGITGASTATIVLDPLADGGVSTRIVWGGSETLGGQSTLLSARHTRTESDAITANVTVDLINGGGSDVVTDAAAHGVAFVLLSAPDEEQTEQERLVRAQGESALDVRDDLERVGDTGRGILWRVITEVTPRTASANVAPVATGIALTQLLAVAAAVVLAIPTRADRARARARSRVIGRRETL